jgi:hypothetical protein
MGIFIVRFRVDGGVKREGNGRGEKEEGRREL